MLVDPWQSTINLTDALVDLRQPGQTECVPCSKDNVVDIIQLGTIRKGYLPCQRIKAANLFLHNDMGVLEGCPAERWNGFATYGCIHWMLCLRQDFMEYLVRGYRRTNDDNALGRYNQHCYSQSINRTGILTLPLNLCALRKCLLCMILPGNLSSYSTRPGMSGNQGML